MSEIVIYEDGSLVLETTIKDDTVWLNQKQMEKLFGRERSVISKHIKNVFNEGELEEKVVCANFAHTTKHGAIEGKVQSKNVKYYSLDVVISVGYRVKSKRGTQFRIWANSVLKEYIIKGYTLNQERIKEEKLQELEQTISLIKQGLENKELSLQEAKGFVEIVSNYAKSWALLQGYDEQSLEEVSQTCESRFVLDYDECDCRNVKQLLLLIFYARIYLLQIKVR